MQVISQRCVSGGNRPQLQRSHCTCRTRRTTNAMKHWSHLQAGHEIEGPSEVLVPRWFFHAHGLCVQIRRSLPFISRRHPRTSTFQRMCPMPLQMTSQQLRSSCPVAHPSAGAYFTARIYHRKWCETAGLSTTEIDSEGKASFYQVSIESSVSWPCTWY